MEQETNEVSQKKVQLQPCGKELNDVPEDVRDAILIQLHERVAWGKKPTVKSKKLRDDVMQMSFPYKRDTYRALYNAKAETVVLLLVVFKKKVNGQATKEINLAQKRLRCCSN